MSVIGDKIRAREVALRGLIKKTIKEPASTNRSVAAFGNFQNYPPFANFNNHHQFGKKA